MNRLISICLLVLLSFGLRAQDYEGSVGIRGGVSSGFTYKIMLNDERAFEGIFSFRKHGMQFTGMLLNHQPFLFKLSDKLFAYHGMGVHVGYYGRGRCKTSGSNHTECGSSRYFSPSIGIDGMLGVEYRIIKIPLVLAIDYKPYIDVFGTHFFSSNFYDFALAAKYTF
jgi:hypothetical protein